MQLSETLVFCSYPIKYYNRILFSIFFSRIFRTKIIRYPFLLDQRVPPKSSSNAVNGEKKAKCDETPAVDSLGGSDLVLLCVLFDFRRGFLFPRGLLNRFILAETVDVSAYWYSKSLDVMKVREKAKPDEKIFYHFHTLKRHFSGPAFLPRELPEGF